MFWTKKKPEKTPEAEKPATADFSKLTVVLADTTIWWNWGPMNTGDRLLTPWIPFKKWFHGRNESEFFTFRWKNGETTLRRSDIKRFSIERSTKNGDA